MTRPRPLTAREVLGVEKARALADRFKRRAERRRHRHTWTYLPRSIGGWGIARCTSCGQEDLY